MCGQGMQALDYLEASEFIYTNGCIDKLVNWIHGNLFLLGGLALGLAIPQVFFPCSPSAFWVIDGKGAGGSDRGSVQSQMVQSLPWAGFDSLKLPSTAELPLL